MVKLENIIKEEFVEVSFDEIVQFLSVNNLYSLFSKAIELINQHLKNIDNEINNYRILQINHIAITLLIRVNTYLQSLDKLDGQKKIDLQKLAGSICKQILIQITKEHPKKTRNLFIENLVNAIEETCQMVDYNFNELFTFIGLDTLAYEKWVEQKGQDVVIPNINEIETLPGFVWKGYKKDGLNKFKDIIEKLEICPEPDKFIKLFENPLVNLAIELNKTNPPYVLQFFSCVNDLGLISYHSTSGFYQVLRIHVKDFDSVFLKNKEPKRRIDVVKDHKSYPFNKNQFDTLLNEC